MVYILLPTNSVKVQDEWVAVEHVVFQMPETLTAFEVALTRYSILIPSPLVGLVQLITTLVAFTSDVITSIGSARYKHWFSELDDVKLISICFKKKIYKLVIL